MKPSRLILRWKLPFYYGKISFTILRCKFLLLRSELRNHLRVKWIVTRPDLPSPHSAFYKICHSLGYRITTQVKRADDLIVAWEDATIRRSDPALDALAAKHRILNYQCKDISKRHMADVFDQVFGYSLTVDPTQYRGLILRKSNANASHDGVILSGPIAEEGAGFTYQKLVDNVVD